MFKVNKVNKARKILKFLTSFLFKLFQLILGFKERRKDYGVEIFEYFYLPWRTDNKFLEYMKLVENHTLNPHSRLFNLYEISKRYLIEDTSFFEIGCWRGGGIGLVALANKEKRIDYFACDTFSGVVNSSERDSFFKNNEYSDATVDHVEEIEEITGSKFSIIEGNFPSSFNKKKLNKPISLAHIDVDTYTSAKESLSFVVENSIKGAVIILDDYGGWFTDGITLLGNELKLSKNLLVFPNHVGQLIVIKR